MLNNNNQKKMELKDFKQHIENAEKGKTFEYGISNPFSWRGSYDEVAFEILEIPMTREEMLIRIQKAYDDVFYGYKGGEYRFSDWTTVNFEDSGRSYTDGGYVSRWIAKIEEKEEYQSQEDRLVKLAFS